MERSRSKRNYYYDQDYESSFAAPQRAKRHHHQNHQNHQNHHQQQQQQHNNFRRGGIGGRMSKGMENSGNNGAAGAAGTVSYRILCHDVKAGGVIGKSGSIIKAIRQETGAWINVHQVLPGDEERIIEISEVRRRGGGGDADGRMGGFSAAQEALLMIHERILESDGSFGYGSGGRRRRSMVVGERGRGRGRRGEGFDEAGRGEAECGVFVGERGKIIEQMRVETKTQIRVLPRDHTLPRCVSMSEEIVQIVGDINAVKKAVEIISARLRESQLRDRSHFHGRLHSPDRFFPDEDFTPVSRRGSTEGPNFGSRFSSGPTNVRNSASRSSGYAFESGVSPVADAQPFPYEDIVFQILCPNDKVDRVMGETDGILELLRAEIGVEVKISDPIPGSNERIITISSDEGPDDELFPAQEALLHIQSQIVELGPDKDNIITTRLLVPSNEIGCLEGRDGSLLEMRKLTGANIQILPREEHPLGTRGDDELLQIVGEITAARDALVEVTLKLRSSLFQDATFQKDLPASSISTSVHTGSTNVAEADSANGNLFREGHPGNDAPASSYQNIQTGAASRLSKDILSSGGGLERKERDASEDAPSGLNRLSVPLVTKSTLEVIIPEHAIPKLIVRNKLAQISELSGASVSLVEDRPEQTEKTIRISGTPEQAERAQSLLQGFILSTQEDALPG
ncbi:hypothetical protein Syun_019799 [Stephania yunnanensis]|uniref:K Homology domain-containing protein n=1 Tax=Stephania yunnanensis TaxID=152371 RepID=A0AAP0NW68_9MAGN